MNTNEKKRLTIHEAAAQGDLATVKTFLIRKGFLSRRPDVNIKDEYENTPLDRASTFGHVEVVRFLLEQGADPNIRGTFGFTPLIGAVGGRSDQAKKKEIVCLLLQYHADPNLPNFDGRVPLIDAPSLDICKALVEAGADVNATDQRNSETPLEMAVLRHHIEIVQYLLERRARPDSADIEGYTPLKIAEKYGDNEISDLLHKYLV